MTFTPDIPISGDTLGSTRDRVRGNFQETSAVFAVNHVGFNNLGKGKHIYLQMPEVAASGAGVPVTLANEAGFYTKNGTNPVEPNLWFRGQTNGYEYQLTSANQANNATFGTYTVYDGTRADQTGGWTFLPGGLLLQYGTRLFSSGTFRTASFPITFTTLYSLTYSTKSFRSTKISSETTSGFQLDISSADSGARFYWQAIGLA